MRAASGGGQPRSTSSIKACRSTAHSRESCSASRLSKPALRSRLRRHATISVAPGPGPASSPVRRFTSPLSAHTPALLTSDTRSRHADQRPFRVQLSHPNPAGCTLTPIAAGRVGLDDWRMVQLAIRCHPRVPVSADELEHWRSGLLVRPARTRAFRWTSMSSQRLRVDLLSARDGPRDHASKNSSARDANLA